MLEWCICMYITPGRSRKEKTKRDYLRELLAFLGYVGSIGKDDIRQLCPPRYGNVSGCHGTELSEIQHPLEEDRYH
ncbi:hypothetical protein ACFOHW_25950 [Paenibacillus abyssi]|uniref:hypothetical protein n=1 Tax=Paenibacillus abyssi TaxID=1340531 RepID=UPI003614F350